MAVIRCSKHVVQGVVPCCEHAFASFKAGDDISGYARVKIGESDLGLMAFGIRLCPKCADALAAGGSLQDTSYAAASVLLPWLDRSPVICSACFHERRSSTQSVR